MLSISAIAQEEMKSDVGITRGKNIHIWPIVYIDKSESEKNIQIAASVFLHKKNLLNTDLHTHLLPFYTYSCASQKKDIRLGSIYYPSIYRYSANFSRKIQSYKVLEILPNIDLLEFTRSENGDYLKNNLLFFLSYKNDKITDQSHFVFFPLYYYYREKQKSRSVLFPIFSHRHTEFKNTTWVFPLIFRKHYTYGDSNQYEQKRLTAFPVYFRNRRNDTFGKHKTDVLFPLVWSYQKPESHSLVVMPFYGYGKNVKEQETFYGITPLVWNISRPHFNYHLIFPVYWRKNQTLINDSIRSTVLFPLYFRKVSSSSYPSWRNDSASKKNDSNFFHTNNTTLFPVYWNEHSTSVFDGKTWSSNDYFAIMPFYGKGKRLRSWDSIYTSYSNITPFYWQSSNLNTIKKTLFPIWWYKKDLDTISRDNHFVVFPIYWHYRWRYSNDKENYLYKSDVLFPLFWNVDRGESHTRTFLPFFHYRYNEKSKYFSLYAFPVFLNYKNSKTEQHFVFPLYHSYKSQYYQSKTIFPLVSFGKDIYNHNHHFVLTPLFWNFNNNKQNTSLLFPIYFHQLTYFTNTQKDYLGLILYQRIKNDSSVSHRILWPIIAYDKSPTSYAFRLAPLFWLNKNTDRNSWGLLPFFYKRKSPTYKTYNFLWQLYAYKNLEGIYSRHNFLGPTFSVVNFQNHDYDVRFLYLLYANSKVGGTVTKSVFPIYFHKHDSIGNRSTSVGFAFYNSFKRKIHDTDLFYKEVRILWFMRLRSNAYYLRSKGIEVDRKLLRSQS